jgi:hypothetical protein
MKLDLVPKRTSATAAVIDTTQGLVGGRAAEVAC